jgi:Ca-activated chloride channel homolog
VILVITDGNDNASLASIEQVRKVVERGEIAVFGIGLFKEDDDQTAARGRRELDHLTDLTGGTAYYPASADDVHAIALDIARQIRNQYTIGYTPLNQALDGSYRTIRVKVAGVERGAVRARRGYWATPQPSASQ